MAEVERSRPARIVAAGYDAIGEGYHAWSHESPTRLRYAQEVLGRLTPDSRVVDLGCGPGDPATRMLSERHMVVGVDVSAGQLEIARRLAPRALLVRGDLADFALQAACVDAVVSFYATGHLPMAAHATLFASIGTWLKPGGVLVTSAPLESGESIDGAWLGVSMFFGGIGADATLGAIGDAGLRVERHELVADDDAGTERFLWVTAVKP